MTDLVALDSALGPKLVEHIRRAHDRGRAVCILDARLSAARRLEVIEALEPTIIIDADGIETINARGRAAESGDGLVVLTSGTSGPPKAAVLTWSAVIASAEMTSRELYLGQPTVWNACLPPSHVGGFAVLARSVFSEDQLMWGDLARLETGPHAGATHVAVVRTQVMRFDLSGYRTVLLGGSRPPSHLASNVVTTWGLTETGSGVVYNGRPLPGVHVTSINGELFVQSPTLLRAYRDGSTPLVTGPDGRNDWLPTGDGGEVIDGIVQVHGRLDYVINTGGEKVWPEDLETILNTADSVTDVAVIGEDDPEWGQRVVALVVSEHSISELTKELGELARDRLGPWAKPKVIHIVREIPRTENGKIRRDELTSLLSPPHHSAY